MPYTAATAVQSPQLIFFQWARPEEGAENPRLNGSIDDDTTTLVFTSAPKDKNGNIVTLGFLMGIETTGGYVETVYVPAGALSANGLVATNVVRGVRLEGLDFTTGDSSLAVGHNDGDKIFCNISGVLETIIMNGLTGQIGANIKFNGRMLFMGSGVNAVGVFANATARDAAITAPANGDQCYLSDSGLFYDYTAGSWIARASGGVFPNASTTVAGKIEIATQAENNAGTAAGGTLAPLVATPDLNGKSVQNGSWNHSADIGSANVYKGAYFPTITALVDGMRLYLTIANANSGASTFTPNDGGIAPLPIVKGISTALQNNDLPVGMKAELAYSAANNNWQLGNSPPLGVGVGETDALVTAGTLGETFSASDLTNNLTLAYMNSTDMKWYKVTSSASTWYGRLGIVLQAGVANDAVKILLKGKISGQSFANINPTFSSALTGTDNNVGDTTARALRAFVISNTAGAEAISTGGTISAKQQGAPAGDMQIYLMLEQQEQANTPAGFRDTSNNVGKGAILASATISQALFSGTYQNLSFSWGANIQIPAGCRVYLVIGKPGAADAANYYVVQSNAATLSYSTASPGWSGTANAGNLTLTITSTSPLGYGVKAYTGSNGSFGLTPSNPWSRVLGRVLSSSEMYFDPEQKRTKRSYAELAFSATVGGIFTVTDNYCPSEVIIILSVQCKATTPLYALYFGNIRGDTSFATTFNPSNARGRVNNLDSMNFLQGAATNPAGTTTTSVDEGKMVVAPDETSPTTLQNELYMVRLESGYIVYNGYPTGSNFVSGGEAGYSKSLGAFALESRI